jgi:hypothetical protein
MPEDYTNRPTPFPGAEGGCHFTPQEDTPLTKRQITMFACILGAGMANGQPNMLNIAPLDPSVAPYVSVAPSSDVGSVTITNISSQPLRGASLEFSGHVNYVRLMADSTQPMMAPGAHWTYYATQLLEMAVKGQTLPSGITLQSILAELEQTTPTVTVNWVVDQSMHMIGPDPHNTFARLTAEHDARQQLASQLSVASGAPAVLSVLDAANSIQPGPANGLYNRDFFNEQIKRDGRRLLNQFNAGWVGAVPDYISRVQREMALSK